jgi:hypothetical protein
MAEWDSRYQKSVTLSRRPWLTVCIYFIVLYNKHIIYTEEMVVDCGKNLESS